MLLPEFVCLRAAGSLIPDAFEDGWIVPEAAAAAAAAGSEPVLAITHSQADLIVSWPLSAADWVLEWTDQLPPLAPWKRMAADAYQIGAASRFVRFTPTAGQSFFRLRPFAPPVAGLTGQWSFEEGQGMVAIESGSGLGTMMLSNTEWTVGRIGSGALHFNGGAFAAGGSRAWFRNDDYAILPPTGLPFSVSFWFSPESLAPGWQGLAGNQVPGTNGWRLALHNLGPGTNELVFDAPGPVGSLSVTGRVLLLPGEWHQLVLTHDGARGALYMDSEAIAQGTGVLATHPGPVFLGGGVGGYDSFLGRIDEVRVQAHALAAEQVALRGGWRFDEPGGVVLNDESPEGRPALLSNAAARAPGHDGSGVDLTLGRVIIHNEDLTALPGSGGPFSVSCWVRPGLFTAGTSSLFSCLDGTNGGWMLFLRGDGGSGVTAVLDARPGGGTLALETSLPLAAGDWARLDLTFNGGLATMYLNGRAIGAAMGAVRASRAPLLVGASGLWPGANLVIDDLQIHGRERGAAEIGPVAGTLWESVLLGSTTNIALSGSGPAGRALTFRLVSDAQPTNGVVTLAPGSGTATYQAGARKGPDAFAYVVSDGEFTSAPAVVALSVVEPHWLESGTGVAVARDGRSPTQAWLAGSAPVLDEIWRTNSYFDCFFYAPGVYETRGWKYYERITANPGCKHIGAGSEPGIPTIIRLVDILESFAEEVIFAPRSKSDLCDNFEVHHLVLDCNATNLPKFIKGAPVELRVPLSGPGLVRSVTVHWGEGIAPGFNVPFARAVEFSISALNRGSESFVTNVVASDPAALSDVVGVGVEADEVVLRLLRRAAGAEFYAVARLEIDGPPVSLPTALGPGGAPSLFDLAYSFLQTMDGNPGTFWISGAETNVAITLPLDPGTAITQVNFQWNCRPVDELGFVGPAATYRLQVRDEVTGQFNDVPFVPHARVAGGWEAVTFGSADATNVIVTDRVRILLSSPEPWVNNYGLREVTAQRDHSPVGWRLPRASHALGANPILGIFEAAPVAPWAGGVRGGAMGINVAGNNLKFTHLKFVNFGTTVGVECFPFFFGTPTPGPAPRALGNVLVEDCVFRDPAPHNSDGLTTLLIAAWPPDTLSNAVVRRCTVSGVKSAFTYSHGFSAPLVEQCLVQDCQIGMYYEPQVSNVDDVGAVVARSNRFENVTSGFYLLSHVGAQFDTVHWLRNEIIMDGSGGWGLAACDVCDFGPSGSITNVLALGNVIRYADWAPRPHAMDGGWLYSDMQHAVFGNNLVALGTPSACRVRNCPAGLILPPDPAFDCNASPVIPPTTVSYPPCVEPLRPGYRRAWFNNRDLSGVLRGVRFTKDGVDGPAPQQQWSE